MNRVSTILNLYTKEIAEQQNVERSNILLSTSICSDEIHNSKEALYGTNNAVFQLGGLGGYPHAGVTGINAFLDHVPDDGVAVIFYGPHIGKNASGTFGLLQRPNQGRETPTCGALYALYNDKSNVERKEQIQIESKDFQLDYLKYRIYELKTNSDINSIENFTSAFYDIVHNDLLTMIEKSNLMQYKFPLYLLGGIIINTERGNFLEIRNKQIFNKNVFNARRQLA